MKEQILVNENNKKLENPKLMDFLTQNVTFDPTKRTRTMWFQMDNLHTHDAFTTPKYDENDKLYYEVEVKDIEKMNPQNKFDGNLSSSFNFYPDEGNFEVIGVTKEFENIMEKLHQLVPKRYERFKLKKDEMFLEKVQLQTIQEALKEFEYTGEIKRTDILRKLFIKAHMLGFDIGFFLEVFNNGTAQEFSDLLLKISDKLEHYIKDETENFEPYNLKRVLDAAYTTLAGANAPVNGFVKNPTQEQVRQFVANNPDKIVKGKAQNPVYAIRQRITKK